MEIACFNLAQARCSTPFGIPDPELQDAQSNSRRIKKKKKREEEHWQVGGGGGGGEFRFSLVGV